MWNLLQSFLSDDYIENNKTDNQPLKDKTSDTIKNVTKLIINKIQLIKNSKIYINNIDTKLSNFDKRNFIPNIKNFSNITEWKPKVSLVKGIKITINYLLNQKKL